MSDQKGDNTLYNTAYGWLILLGIFAAVFLLIWYYQAEEIRNVIRWIRYAEMWLISWFVGENYAVIFDGGLANFQRGFEYTPLKTKEQLDGVDLSYFNALAMQPLKIPVAVFFVLTGLWAVTRGPNTQYRRKMGLEGLIKTHGEIFPVVSPFADFNPSSQPPRPPGAPVPAELPSFAEALGPEEWLAYTGNTAPDGQVDRAVAQRAFRRQLGKRWKGPRALPAYKQVLLAAFCLKAVRKREESDEMLGRLARCWTFKKGLKLDGKLLREARSILANKKMSGGLLKVCNQHAYETTALLRALAYAREEGGVLAPASFVWLRGHDRALWYPLNNLGRQSFHMEAVGAISHYKQEKRTSRPIPVPKVEDAVDSISEYMSSDKARPIPKLDYSGSKKRAVKKAV